MGSNLTRFEISNHLSIREEAGRPAFVCLRAKDGERAEVCLHGAHVTAWQGSAGDDLLYLSPKAEFAAGKAIRGGVPLIFPQFSGQGPLPSHGFARNQSWELVESALTSSGQAQATLVLKSNENSRAVWPHEFELTCRVSVGDGLKVEMLVRNSGAEPFTFQTAYHTYFAVSDIEKVALRGLKDCEYLDFLNNNSRQAQETAELEFHGHTDRQYLCAPDLIEIVDRGAARTIQVHKINMPDAVVWNPWIEKCAAMKDLPPDGYRHFLCVEGGNITKRIVLEPDQAHTDGHVFKTLALK